MKKIILLFVFATGIVTAQNKEYKHSLEGISTIKILNTSVEIQSTDSKELIISYLEKKRKHKHKHSHVQNRTVSSNESHLSYTFSSSDEKNKKDKRKGLTPIYPNGTDNTGLGFSVKKEGKVLVIRDLKPSIQQETIKVLLPKNINLIVDAGSLSEVAVNGISSEVEVKTSAGNISMKDVTGPITANTSCGDVDIIFAKVNQKSPITIVSGASDIDITLPKKTKSNLEVSTSVGTFYTNFDINLDNKKGSNNRDIKGTINNGGVKIKLKSSMGNIYLRKK